MRPSQAAEESAKSAAGFAMRHAAERDDKNRQDCLAQSLFWLSCSVAELSQAVRYTYNELKRQQHR